MPDSDSSVRILHSTTTSSSRKPPRPKAITTINPSNSSNIPLEVVQSLVEASHKNKEPKFGPEALKATAELMKLFVQEATMRSKHQLDEEGGEEGADLQPIHLAKCLPTLLLDL